MTQRFEGRNLEEAIDHAANAFGVERYRVGYHVVVERRGFLGGIKRIVIEAEVKAEDEVQSPAPAPAVIESTAPSAMRPAPPSDRRSGRSGPSRDRAGRSGRGERSSRDRGPRRGNEDRSGGRFEDEEIVPRQGEESAEARKVRKWLNELLNIAELDLDVRTFETEDEIDVRLYGPDSRLVLTRGGELLDALQVIANKSLVREKSDKSIEIDCRGFKRQRKDSIGEQAREAAEIVRRTGREELLPAMSPIERRIVHLSLQDDPELTTESRGEGFFKRVAILPRKSGEAQEP